MFVTAFSFFQDPFGIQFSSRKQLTQLLHAARGGTQHFGHHGFSDFHHITVAIRANGGTARFASQQRHFAETIARPQPCDLDFRSVFRNENIRCPAQHHEHRIACSAFLNHRFATTEKFEERLVDHLIELVFRKTVKESFSPQDGKGLCLVFLQSWRLFTFNLQCANREGNRDALAPKFVPGIRIDAVTHLVVTGVSRHRELDLINDRRFAVFTHVNLWRRVLLHAGHLNGGEHERIFHTVGRRTVLGVDVQTHEMRPDRVTEIGDGVLDHLIVRNIKVDVVVGAKPRGTPVDLTHLAVGVAHLQPITELVGPIKLDRYAADDPGEQILSSETDDDCDHAGAREQAFQLRLGVIAVTQDQQQDDQKNDTADNLTKKMWNRYLASLFEI